MVPTDAGPTPAPSRDGRPDEGPHHSDFRSAPPPYEEAPRNANGHSDASTGDDRATSFLVEEFLEARQIDKAAADQLRKCRREVQLGVISKADFKHVLNPASHLFSLIGETEARAPDPSRFVNVDQVVAFVQRWSLNVDAQAKLLCLSPDVQLVVMKEFNPPADMLNVNGKFILFAGSLHTAEMTGKFNPRQDGPGGHAHALGSFSFSMQNNSARSVESGGGALNVARDPPPPPPPPQDDDYNREKVEDFIRNMGVDEDSGWFLRNCSPEIQLKVVGMGKLKFALSTPSAALMARIKAVNGCLPSVQPSSFTIQDPPPAAPAPPPVAPAPQQMQQASLPAAMMSQQHRMQQQQQQQPMQSSPAMMPKFQDQSLESPLKKSLEEKPPALQQGWENNLPAFLRKRAKLGIVGPISGPTLPLPPAEAPPPLPDAAQPPPPPDVSASAWVPGGPPPAAPTPSLKTLWHR